MILAHGDVDGVCSAAIARTSYHKAEVDFTNPSDLTSKLNSLSGHDRLIVLDIGIDLAIKNKAIAAFQRLSKTSSIIYIDHHLRPSGVTERSLSCSGMHRTSASTSELAWEYFKPAASHDFIAVLGAIGDYREKTPQVQGLIERYNERRVYPEALFLEWAIMVAEDSFKRGVVEELAEGKWPYQMDIMGREADSIVRRQRTLERYVKEKSEKICEHVMLIRDPPFKATGPAASLLVKLDNVDVGIASRREDGSVYLSIRRHNESDINLAALIDESVSKFGGLGGGHKEAAGGKVPAERFDELLLEIRRRLPEGRLKRSKKLGMGSGDKKTIERKLFMEIIERKRAEERLYESEEKYRIQFEEAIDAIFVTDAETGIIIDCNSAAAKLVGRNKSEIIGQHQKILHPPEKIERKFSRTYKLHIKEKAGQVLETQIITKNGEIRDVAIKANLFEFRGRKMLQGIFRDITESKWAEEKFRNIAEHSPNMIFINKGGRVVYANKRCEEIMGYKREEFYSPDFRFLKLVAPECVDMLRKSFSKHMKGKEVVPFEYTLVTKEGKRIEAILTTKLIQYGGEKVILGTVTDISEHKRAEEELRESKKKLSLIFDNTNDIIVYVDKHGRIQDANKKVEELLGYNRDELVGKNFAKVGIIGLTHIPKMVKLFMDVIRGGGIIGPVELEIKDKNGNKIFVEASTKIIKKDGKMEGIVSILRDISERNKAENRVKMERKAYQSIARAANRSRSVEELCELALSGIREVINYDMADVMVYRESENALLPVAQFGFPEDIYKRTLKRQDLKDGLKVSAQVALNKKSIYVDDMRTSKLTNFAHDLVVKYGISTMYAVPLLNQGKLQGVLEVLTVGGKKLSKEDREVLDTISEELAGGIAKAKLEEQLVTVKDAFGWLSMSADRTPQLNPNP